MKLFVVLLGGSAERANTELHDVVFAVGEKIEDTYQQLLESWFGIPDGLHLDSWSVLDVIDGYKISLQSTPSTDPSRLYFVNTGAYLPGRLGEAHANEFFVATDKREVIKRAKKSSLKGMDFIHRDYLYDVDDCIEITSVREHFVHLTPAREAGKFSRVSAYHLLPRHLVEELEKKIPAPKDFALSWQER